MESKLVLAQNDRCNVISCYRADELILLSERNSQKKNSKKIQKDVFRHTIGITPPAYEVESVHTSPFDVTPNSPKRKAKKVIFDVCDCNDKDMDDRRKYVPSTWESITKLYGPVDTTEVWIDQKNQAVKVLNGKNKHLQHIKGSGDANDNTKGHRKPKRKSKTRKKLAKDKKLKIRNSADQKEILESLDRNYFGTSVISLFRNNKRYLKAPKQKNIIQGDSCKCDLNAFNNELSRDNKLLKVRKNIQNDKVSKSAYQPVKLKCPEGLCVDEFNKGNNNFFCRCRNRKSEQKKIPEQCTNATCKLSRNSLSLNSVVKIKDKVLCICRKLSQKISSFKSLDNICKEGVCTNAAKNHKKDFICKCSKNHSINECSDEICGKNILPKNNLLNFDNVVKHSGLFHNILNQRKKIDNKTIKLDDEGEQTGEPFFEVQVNPRDMCVLNPIEIRENIMKHGRPGKFEQRCICPSRGRLRNGEVCKAGVCKKAYKNKQTNFNCWCEKIRTECGDTTCDVNIAGNKRRKRKNSERISIKKHNKPLLEVQLDKDKMCVVNPKEIEDKIINNLTVDDMCSSGVCRNAALKHNLSFFCKCINKKMNSEITECTEETCMNGTQYKQSKFCLFCARLCSKSENWSSRNRSRNRKRRPTRRSFYDIGLNKYKGNVVTASFVPKEKVISRQEKVKETENNWRNARTHNKNDANITIHPTHKIINENEKTYNTKLPPSKKPKENKLKEKTYCTCAHACECNIGDNKSQLKHEEKKEKLERKKLVQKRRNQIKNQRNLSKEMKRRAKLEKKREKKAAKERLREIKLMHKKMKEEPMDTNFCTACLLGILKIVLRSAVFLLSVVFAIIKDPRGSFWYVRDRIKDLDGTFNTIKKWFSDALILKKLQISETIRGSDTLTILADHFLDTALYQSVADKGRTRQEQMAFEQKSKARKRRIRKRQQQAIFSCRHMLLTTLRQTPCLWVYHICPNFYPQCLSLLGFMRSFSHILLFLVAFACWTPCIVTFELCRAMLCCFMCTG